jgi:hypothetical protein
MGPKRSRRSLRESTQPSLIAPPIVFFLVGAYGLLSLFAVLALAHKTPLGSSPVMPSPSVDPNLNFAGGDFTVMDGWNGCAIHVNLTATSQADDTGASGTITMTGASAQSFCKGQATGRITCLLVSGNFARLSGWLDKPSGMFGTANVVQATLTENDPQTYGPPVDRAGFGVADGSPECPPAIEGKGPQIMSGTLHVSASGQPKPTGQPEPMITPTPAIWPNPSPNMNFAGGDFVVVDGWNDCKVHMKFAATSEPNGAGSTGAFSITALPGGQCDGQASGRVTCLLVNGNSAMYSGWIDDSTGMFSIGNVLQGSVTHNDPQPNGLPVDRAFLGLADGSPECPPALSGPGGPQIVSGTLQVFTALAA